MTVRQRFDSKWKLDPDTGCWVWVGSRIRSGYGVLGIRGHHHRAHRLAWRLYRGPIPRELWVLHHCDNKGCVNPSHLYLGTRADNVRDAVLRGRTPRGTVNGHARLDDEKVRAIRRLAAAGLTTTAAIAARFDVSRPTVHHIVANRTWKHVTYQPSTTTKEGSR